MPGTPDMPTGPPLFSIMKRKRSERSTDCPILSNDRKHIVFQPLLEADSSDLESEKSEISESASTSSSEQGSSESRVAGASSETKKNPGISRSLTAEVYKQQFIVNHSLSKDCEPPPHDHNEEDNGKTEKGVSLLPSHNESPSSPIPVNEKLSSSPPTTTIGVIASNEKMLSSTVTASSPPVAEENVSFRSLGVCEELCLACKALGWEIPTEIQRQALPHALDGRDVIGLAETGSGKTAAFSIPVIQKLLDCPQHKGVFAVVLAPTRELCVQITEQFLALGAAVSLRVCTIVGGLDMVEQARELAKKPHVVVASPGRIVDHLENTKGFTLSSVRFLVMDEADRLLSMDFEDDINTLVAVLPRERNTYLFSATMTESVAKLQRASLVKPVKIRVNSKYETAKHLVQSMKFVEHRFKWVFLVALLTHLKNYTAMVFCNTCLDSMKVAICLRHLGFASVCLHGKMTQPQRLGALNAFKAARKHVLVATEVGSRGLDIPHVDVVVNFDVPPTGKDYIHRVGRTARAGKSGRAVTLVTQYDIETFQRIEQVLNKRLPVYEELKEEAWKVLHEQVSEARRLVAAAI